MKIRSLAVFTIMTALAVGAQTQTSTTKSTNVQPNAQTSKTTVTHDATLQGDGTTTTPLGVAAPLNLGGSVNVSGDSSVSGNSSVGGSVTAGGGIKASTATGSAVEATGGANDANLSSSGVKATGGVNQNAVGGIGVEARGGQGINGGVGVEGRGGDALDTASGFVGGLGVRAIGGINAGTGLLAIGGDSPNGFSGGFGAIISGGQAPVGDGGTGMFIQGGIADGAGHTSGGGIVVRAGVGFNGASRGLAGQFSGDVHIDSNLLVDGNVTITGNVAKGSGSFKIDHPLDPENKFLSHSFVESPDMMNIYNGTTLTDAKGNATVTLPDWFEALNQDFRYQLTVIGTFAQAIVGDEIKGNHFTVKTSQPNVKVSWQVTGIRHDAYANMHRIAVEERKAEGERGLYLHPDAFNQPESKAIQAVRMTPQTEKINAVDEHAGQGSQQ
jgi:trimeric autotransporter adhesin